jgi:hypothetical protein
MKTYKEIIEMIESRSDNSNFECGQVEIVDGSITTYIDYNINRSFACTDAFTDEHGYKERVIECVWKEIEVVEIVSINIMENEYVAPLYVGEEIEKLFNPA